MAICLSLWIAIVRSRTRLLLSSPVHSFNGGRGSDDGGWRRLQRSSAIANTTTSSGRSRRSRTYACCRVMLPGMATIFGWSASNGGELRWRRTAAPVNLRRNGDDEKRRRGEGKPTGEKGGVRVVWNDELELVPSSNGGGGGRKF
jgi:hypothetical protein